MPSPCRILIGLVVLAGTFSAGQATAQIVIMHSFTGGVNDGQNPAGALTASGNMLFGMTGAGGSGGDGTIFQIGTGGAGYTTLHNFTGGVSNDGGNPYGSLTLSGTTLIGMTSAGGTSNDGTVFQIGTTGGNFGLLHSFTGAATDGGTSLGSLIQSGSTLFGTTNQGGTANMGTVFTINTDASGFGVIHSFTGSPGDGSGPGFSALAKSGAALYGTTPAGGAHDFGTLFKQNTDGTGYALVNSFNAASGGAWDPVGTLAVSGSILYGMTRQGGGGAGTIFKENTDGTGFTTMHTFLGTPAGDGANPLGSLLIAGSEMYGMTPGGGTAGLGTVFEMGLDGTGYTVLHSFMGGTADGSMPQGDLTIVDSTLYGMTVQGGTNNDGVIFGIAVPEPSSLLLLAAAAAAGVIARRRLRRVGTARLRAHVTIAAGGFVGHNGKSLTPHPFAAMPRRFSA